MTRRPLAAAAGVGLLVVLSAAPAQAVTGEPVLRLRDPAITESSGLVDLGATMVTTNDSGSTARLYVLGADGRTVGTTDFGAPTVDVEALAPAGGSSVWVGDVGDNTGVRRSVQVYRVPVGTGARRVSAAAYELVYPGRRHPDAESLFVDQSGRLTVITKSFTGGTAYRAPRRLRPDRPNRLVAVGKIAEYATDAALLRDRRHVLVRGYGQAGVYDVATWRRVGGFDLPAQPQGEGVSVGPGGRVRLSSEGVGTPVLQVALPPSLRRELRSGGSPSATPAPTPAPTPNQATAARDGSSRGTTASDRPWRRWAVPGVLVAGVLALGSGLVLRRRGR